MMTETERPSLGATASLVLQPLSEATKTVIAPLKLRPSDRLYVWLDDNARNFLVEAHCVDPETGKPTYMPGLSQDAQSWSDRVPERKWLGQKEYELRNRYQLAATDYSALVIHHAWPKEQVLFQRGPTGEVDDNARSMFEFLLRRFMVQGLRAVMQAEYKLTKKVPKLPEAWTEHQTLPLIDYQKVAVAMTAFQPSTGLFMDRGTGKTPTVIQRFCVEGLQHHRDTGKMYRVLVVCPPQVRRNWFEEVQRFSVVPGKAVVVKGGQRKRIKQLVHAITTEPDLCFSVAIIGYDSIVSSIESFAKVPWDLIVLDESHWIKSSSTKRWQALKQLRDSSNRRMVLTGTPIGNSIMDLWTQLEFLGEGLSGFNSYKDFRSFHGEWEQVDGHQSGVQRLIEVKGIPLIQERLARLTFSVTKEEAGLKLPSKLYDVWEVTMTPEQSRIYQKIAEELALEIEDTLSGETNQLTVEHILTRLLRLSQITSGFLVFDPPRDPYTNMVVGERIVKQIEGNNPKIDAVMEMIEAEDRDPLGKMIIWCHWVEDIQHLHRELEKRGVEHVIYYGKVSQDAREEAVERYNKDPDCRVMVCNPQTAAEGLNLLGYDWNGDPANSHTYTDHEVFFSQNWSSILREQAEDRAHRKGARVPIRITDLMVLGTIDEEIRKRVKAKSQMAYSVLDIKNILSSVLNIEGEEDE